MTVDAITYPRRFADTCGCRWAKECPEFHDVLVRVEVEEGVDAGLILLNIACLGDYEGAVPDLGKDPDEFERFVSEHNWRDPVSMADLARAMTWVSKGYWKGCDSNDRSAASGGPA